MKYLKWVTDDPYRGLYLPASTHGLRVPESRVVNNLVWKDDPRDEVWLVLQRADDNKYFLVAWSRTPWNVIWFDADLEVAPSSVLNVGSWTGQEMLDVRIQADSDLRWLKPVYNDPWMASLGAVKDAAVRARFYKWTFEAFGKAPVPFSLVPISDIEEAYEPVFRVFDKYLKHVFRRKTTVDPYAKDPNMPPPYYGGLPPRAPRTPGITRDRVEKLRRARLREGYDYNPRERLAGGLASGREPWEFDEAELRLGIETELEHTDDPELAREIAMDHLVEHPRYYTRLREAGL